MSDKQSETKPESQLPPEFWRLRNKKRPQFSTTDRLGCVVVVIAVLALLSYVRSCSDEVTPEQKAAREEAMINEGGFRVEARTAADRLIRPYFKSPSRAKVKILEVDDHPDGSYTIRGYVDAQNDFGATIRKGFRMEIKYYGNGQWLVTKAPMFFRL